MKKILYVIILSVFLALPVSASEVTYNFINDNTSTLSTDEVTNLQNKCNTIKSITDSRVYLYVISSLDTNDHESLADINYSLNSLDGSDMIIIMNLYDNSVSVHYYDDLEDNLSDESLTDFINNEINPLLESGEYYKASIAILNSIMFPLLVNRLVPNGFVKHTGILIFVLLALLVALRIRKFKQDKYSKLINEEITNLLLEGHTDDYILKYLCDNYEFTHDDAISYLETFKTQQLETLETSDEESSEI